MKFTKFLLIAAAAAMAFSCAKENDLGEMPQEQPKETRVSTEMLSFSSIEEMQQQIDELGTMDEEALSAWYANKNFESQYAALYRVAAKFDEAQTLEEAESIKAEHATQFLFNENPADDELFNPYLRNENPDYAYVCNANGEVIIGGEVVNFNTITDVRNTHEYQITHKPETRGVDQSQNYLKGTTKRHKFWAEGRYSTESHRVQIEFTAHHKNMFGWNKYACKYHIKIAAQYRDARKNGWTQYGDFVNSFFAGVDKKLYTPAQGCWTNKFNSHYRVSVGTIPSKSGAGVVIRIYSDGTGAEAEGDLKIFYYAQ